MAKNVIIFGAGASVPFGGPVMSNFLDVAEDLTSGLDQDTQKSFNNVFSAVSELQTVHSKSEFDLINLESIFTAFELSKVISKFPGRNPDQIDQLIDDLKKLIIVTLERKILFPAGQQSELKGHPPVVEFLENFASMDGSTPSVAILTFNYDLVIDVACYDAGIGIDYRIPVAGPAINQPALPVLKLHGSLNWGVEDSESKTIHPWPIRSIAQMFQFAPRRKNFILGSGSNIQKFKSVGNIPIPALGSLPLIVPPSWNKADSHRPIATVWAEAAKELGEADSIYVIGYSLPETDSFFRQLYALGTVGTTRLRRFWVFNPDPSREKVFSSLLGPGARGRYKFFGVGLDEALQTLERELFPKKNRAVVFRAGGG